MRDFYKDKNKTSRYNYERWYIVVRVKSIMNYAESCNVVKSLTPRRCVEEILNAKIKRLFSRMLRWFVKNRSEHTPSNSFIISGNRKSSTTKANACNNRNFHIRNPFYKKSL